MKTSLISPFSIFLSGLFTDKHLFLKLNKLVLHTFNFSFFKKTGLVFMIHPEKIYRERIFLIYVGGEDGVPQPDPTPKSINPSKFLFPPHQGFSPLLNKKFHVTTQQKRHVQLRSLLYCIFFFFFCLHVLQTHNFDQKICS